MRDWLEDNKESEDDMDPYAISHLGWGLNPQALWYGIALMAMSRSGAGRRRELSRAIPVLNGPEFSGRRQAKHAWAL